MEGIPPSVDGIPLAETQNSIEIFGALAPATADNSREAALKALAKEGISASDLPELHNDDREVLNIALKNLAHSHHNAVISKYCTAFVPIVVQIYRVNCSGETRKYGDRGKGT